MELTADNPRTAAFYLESLFRRLRTDPWIQPDLLSTAFRMAIRLGEASPALARDLDAALEEPFAVGLADRERLTTRLNLAAHSTEEGRGARRSRTEPPPCVGVFAEMEPWVPWNERHALRSGLLLHRGRLPPPPARPPGPRGLPGAGDPGGAGGVGGMIDQLDGRQTQSPAVSM